MSSHPTPSAFVPHRPNTAKPNNLSNSPPILANGTNPQPSSSSSSSNPAQPIDSSDASISKSIPVSHYSVGKSLGQGTFGKVKKGIHKLTGLPVAIKILEKEKIKELADVERVRREISILTRVRHPNVIRLYEVIDSPRHIFLIMDYMSGGELFDYIVKAGRVPEPQACKFFHQILNGVDYFHLKNITHRDLKPENLLIDADLKLKIVDFGLGNLNKPGKLLKTACGRLMTHS
jgi:5'-AMP-activated protein kinase catalytic alpha subunit